MKKTIFILVALTLLCAAFIIPTAAYTDGEVIYSEDFTNPTLDYTDKNDNYEAVVVNGKLELTCFSGSKIYKLPFPDVTGLDKFTVVYDWQVVANPNPSDAGHTLYFVFGVKDDINGIYVGHSHVNGTEHLGTIINGSWGRKYRTHYSDADTKSNMAALGTNTFRIKIEVENGESRVFVNGKRYVLDSGEEWRDADKVQPLWYDGGFGFVSRGPGFDAYVDNIVIYAGTGIEVDAMPNMTEDTTAETTTTAPVDTTTEAPVDTTTPADTTTAAKDTTTAAPKDTTTAAPKDTTTAGKSEKSGCGSVVALGLMACVIPAAVVLCRKNKHRK